MKTCTKCGVKKQKCKNNFYSDKRMNDGYRGTCKKCVSITHEKFASKNRELFIWKSMINRCYNEKTQGYKYYGQRGIKISDEWLDSYDNFIKDMGKRPSDKHTIERVDNEKGYSKENCVWATQSVQNRNRRMLKENSSGHAGVYWHKQSGRWHARVFLNYKSVSLGTYADLDNAIEARKNGEIEYYK